MTAKTKKKKRRLCIECGDPISTQAHKFCSRECAWEYNRGVVRAERPVCKRCEILIFDDVPDDFDSAEHLSCGGYCPPCHRFVCAEVAAMMREGAVLL